MTVRRLFQKKAGRFLFAGLVLGALALGFLWMVGSALSAPAQRTVAMGAGFSGTDVTFQSASGATLHGNLLRGRPRKGMVVLMHGVRGNRGDLAEHARFLHSLGYSVLLFDFQAHGESSGQKITSGYLESRDASAAVSFARRNAPDEKIAVLGVSLGGAATVLAEPAIDADAMILEMVYPDIRRAVKNRIAIVLGNWARIFSPLLTCQLKWRVGVNADWFSPKTRIANIHCPKLIIAGANDRHTTLHDSKDLFVAAPEPKELWIVENAAHENLHAATRAEYEKRIVLFLENAFAKQSER